MRHIEELILFRNLCNNRCFRDMTELIRRFDKGDASFGRMDLDRFSTALSDLIEIAVSHGFSGELWKDFLALSLVRDENAYSLSAEQKGRSSGSLSVAAESDLSLIREYYNYDMEKLAKALGLHKPELLRSFELPDEAGNVFSKRIRDRIMELAAALTAAEDDGEFQSALERFYKEFGTGSIGLHKVFRISEGKKKEVLIRPIRRIEHANLSDLVGLEIQKKKLTDNTEAFVAGKPANNCLLYGDAGTGKSSSIKALANRYFERGLRIIELYKHQLYLLPGVIDAVKSRNYRFIIYMDDLSFEDFETDYKYLKAVIEGGLEKKPENVLIYATSNRRHLIRESFTDRDASDLHQGDTVQEKQSLSARFGVTIYFGAPTPDEFREIVRVLAREKGIDLPEKELLARANEWEQKHGGRSGRTAQQFINYLLGQQAM